MKTIVLAYDETDPAKRALERTTELATAFGAHVVVTSVAPVLHAMVHGIGPFDHSNSPEMHREQQSRAFAALRRRGVDAEMSLGLGDAADEIVRLADQRDADLIVVGTQDPSVVSRLLGRSVSGAVQRKARCDVLVVH
jgi:nucleotide-binding universal stress UspA family protein